MLVLERERGRKVGRDTMEASNVVYFKDLTPIVPSNMRLSTGTIPLYSELKSVLTDR